MKLRAAAAAFTLACVLSTGCDLLTKKETTASPTSPTSPTPTTSVDAFAGTWASVTTSTPPTGCGNLRYTITPTTATTANVSFTATCAGNIAVTGSGAGTLSGSVINWSASGLVAQGGVNCPFAFTNSKATLESATQILVNYTGTVCGIPISGTETIKK
ncbi:MAG: hypothetical protein ABIQ52_08425 [Vicinamibacterales bacterium]